MQEFSETFQKSDSLKSLATFNLGFVSFIFILSLAFPIYFHDYFFPLIWLWAPISIGLGYVVKCFFREWQERNDFISVSETGIARNSLESIKEYISWKDVVDIKEQYFSRRLIILGQHQKKIKIDYGLSNFIRLLNISINSAPQLTQKYTTLNAFRRTIHFHVFFSVLFLIFLPIIIGLFLTKMVSLIIFGALLSIIGASPLLAEWFKVEIEEKTISLVSLLRKRKFTLSQIKYISLENIPDRYGFPLLSVLLKLQSGKNITLYSLKDGVVALFYAMKNKMPEKIKN